LRGAGRAVEAGEAAAGAGRAAAGVGETAEAAGVAGRVAESAAGETATALKPKIRVQTTPEGKTLVRDASGELRPVEEAFVDQLGQDAATAGKRPAAGVEPLAVPLKGTDAPKPTLMRSIYRHMAPEYLSDAASEAGVYLRKRLGELARDRDLNSGFFRGVTKSLDKMSEAERMTFISNMEKGVAQATPALDETAAAFRKGLTEKWREVQAVDPESADRFIEHYFPHIWKDPEQAARVYGRGSLGGQAGFRQTRTIPTVEQGLNAGLTLKDTNPAHLVVRRLDNMDQYLMGKRFIQDLEQNGLARAFKADDAVPAGWERIPDKLANKGPMYAPSDAVQLIKNHLTPGFAGQPWYDAIRGTGNLLNQMQLGWSGFHYVTTAVNSQASQFALGLRQAVSSGVQLATRGKGLVNMATSPFAPLRDFQLGAQVRNAYRGLGGSPKLEAAAEQITAAGGRTTLDQVYRMQSEGTSLQKWQQAIRDRKLSAIPRTIPALTEMTSHPLFEQWVPKIKLGAFTRLAAFDLQKLGPEATELQKIKALQGAWDSIDNRFGQLVYDNLFWPKALKDTGMVGVRALGWYLGTARELGGALYEAGKVPLGMQRQISNKMAYTASLPVVVGLQGALLNYLWTGEAPQSLKDYFYPRTGHIRPDGTPERVQLPSYLKDVYGLATDATATLKGKIHPMWSIPWEMLSNRTFGDHKIREPKDPIVTQALDELGYLVEQVIPISMRAVAGVGQQPKPGYELSKPLLPMVGITRAPSSIEPTKGSQKFEQQHEKREQRYRDKQRQQGGVIRWGRDITGRPVRIK